MRSCPQCGGKPFKIIYFGLPHLFCQNPECNCMYGFWANVTQYFPFNGWLMTYEGSYASALWWWLTNGWGQDGD